MKRCNLLKTPDTFKTAIVRLFRSFGAKFQNVQGQQNCQSVLKRTCVLA